MLETVARLEEDWLAAEAKADELKALAKRSSALALPGAPAELGAKYAAAEQAASDAFDRFWIAREQN